MVNVRIRGKIKHEEWPKIAARYQAGETLTEIARSYNCTAPAIRYIVQRAPARSVKGQKKTERDKSSSVSILPARFSRAAPAPVGGGPEGLQRSELWQRITTDIASYLAAMDALALDDSEANYEAMLEATDRLLRASARTRLELEKTIAQRRKSGQVRRFPG